MPGVVIPTGFETQQALIALRQKLADAMLQQGLTPQEGMRSPLQVLGQWAQTAAGGHLEHQALTSEKQLDDQIRQVYFGAHDQLASDIQAGMPAEQVLAKYGKNPFLADDPLLKGVSAGFSKGQETGQEFGEHNGIFGRNVSFEGQRDTGDPIHDKNLIIGGNIVPNEPVIAAEQATSPFNQFPGNLPRSMPYPSNLGFPATAPGAASTAPGTTPPSATPTAAPTTPGANDPTALRQQVLNALIQQESGGRDYGPDGKPLVNPQTGAMGAMQVLPSTANNPGYGITPAASYTPQEYDRVGQDYLGAMYNKFHNLPEALGAYHDGPGNMQRAGSVANLSPVGRQYVANIMARVGGGNSTPNVPMATANGTNLNSSRPPDSMTVDGRPVWLINGQYYDNPQGN